MAIVVADEGFSPGVQLIQRFRDNATRVNARTQDPDLRFEQLELRVVPRTGDSLSARWVICSS